MQEIENERLDRMEDHLRLLKKSNEAQNSTLNSIENALVGTIYNGNKGITHMIHDIDKRVKNLEDDYSVTKENMRQIKLFAGGLGGLIFGYILFLISR